MLLVVGAWPGPVRADEWFGPDERVKDNFSASAAATSDALLLVTMTLPLALHVREPLDAAGERLLIYGEAVGINLAVNWGIKHLVGRPRPYTHNQDARVQRWAAAQGRDARLSFYSGHASTAFAAAVTGSLLYAAESDDDTTRAIVWGVHLAFATATANLRVRAGKHYYTDVVTGALAGVAIGALVPIAQSQAARDVRPSGIEWGAIAGGVFAGAVVSQLVPFKNDIAIPLGDDARVSLHPLSVDGGGGVLAIGSF